MTPTATTAIPRFGSTYSPSAGKARTALDDGARRIARLAAAGADADALIAHALGVEAAGPVGEWLRREVARVEERDVLAHALRVVGPDRVRSLEAHVRALTAWSPLDPPRGWLLRDLALALDVTPRTAAADVVVRLAPVGLAVAADDAVVTAMLAEAGAAQPS